MPGCTSMCVSCARRRPKCLSSTLIKRCQLYLVDLSFKWVFRPFFHFRQTVIWNVSNPRLDVYDTLALRLWSLYLLQRGIWMRPTSSNLSGAVTDIRAVLIHTRLRVMITNIIKRFVIMIMNQFKILYIVHSFNAFKNVHFTFNHVHILLKAILIVFLLLVI